MGPEPEPKPTPPREPEPAALTPLLGDVSRRLTARQVVERLQPWRPPPTQEQTKRPRVLLNMVCTADGRATLGGRSGSIGNRADRELFHALRTAVDGVLVGAGTVRAEHYRALVREEAHRRLRRERGLAEEPLACIVSGNLDLPDVPLLSDPGARVAILTASPTGQLSATASPTSRLSPAASPTGELSPAASPTGELSPAASVEYVRSARNGLLDLPAALAELRARLGVRTLLCEGGPHLNGQLLAEGLVDELFLSFAPKLGGGEPGQSPRIISGPELDPPVALELLDVLESESNLLLRYRVGGGQ
jgi:riboflavin biosynthesis pyrimidine reductase